MSIQQLQLAQQNLQNIIMQKQQTQNQIVEFNSALDNLKNTNQAYRITGKIMIAQNKEKLTKELSEKKETAEVRLKNFEKQEEKLKSNMEELQKSVMEEMKKEKKD